MTAVNLDLCKSSFQLLCLMTKSMFEKLFVSLMLLHHMIKLLLMASLHPLDLLAAVVQLLLKFSNSDVVVSALPFSSIQLVLKEVFVLNQEFEIY